MGRRSVAAPTQLADRFASMGTVLPKTIVQGSVADAVVKIVDKVIDTNYIMDDCLDHLLNPSSDSKVNDDVRQICVARILMGRGATSAADFDKKVQAFLAK